LSDGPSPMPKFFCVDSPFVEYCSIEAGERLSHGVRSRVSLRPELTNSLGGAHGGLIATLLDASMTVAARYALDPEGREGVATVDLCTTFIGQAKAEATCEATVTGRRGSILYLEAQARNEDGDLIARAIATFKAVGRKKE
jgi:acyl-coenzyme A thioesterase PaaI-like protein